MEEKELSEIEMDYIRLLWVKKNLIILGAVVCAVTAGIVSFFLPKTYEATVNLKVGKTFDIFETSESFKVSENYIENPYVVAQTIDSEPFLAKIANDLGLPFSPERMTKMVNAKVIETGGSKPELIKVVVRGRSGKEAYDTLSHITVVVLDRYKKKFEDITQQQLEYEKGLVFEIKGIESDIEDMKKQQKAFIKINKWVATSEILILQAVLEKKQEQMLKFSRELRNIRISLIKSIPFEIKDLPVMPDKAVKQKILLNIIIAGVSGFILAIMIVLFMESLSRSAKDLQDKK